MSNGALVHPLHTQTSPHQIFMWLNSGGVSKAVFFPKYSQVNPSYLFLKDRKKSSPALYCVLSASDIQLTSMYRAPLCRMDAYWVRASFIT
jgi:hypothetical protein